MKKIVLSMLAISSLTFTNHAFAQKGFSLSVKGTPHISWLQNSDDNDNSQYDRKTTFAAGFGVGAAYNFTDHLGVGLDVLYSLQGQKFALAGTEYRQKVDYLKIPVMFAYNTDPSKKISFIGKLGPQLSLLTASRLDDGDGHKLADTKDRYKDITFGGVALAGAQYRLDKNIFLTAAARYDLDFTNAEDDGYSGYETGRADTHNTTLGLEVGLKYLLH